MELLIRLEHIHQMMGHTLHLFLPDLRRTDIHMLIDLHGVRRNDLSVHQPGQTDG